MEGFCRPGPSLAALLPALSHDASALVRLEFSMARAVVAGFAAVLGLLVLLAALVLAVGDLMDDRYALGALAAWLLHASQDRGRTPDAPA